MDEALDVLNGDDLSMEVSELSRLHEEAWRH